MLFGIWNFVFLGIASVIAIDLDTSSKESICSATSLIQEGILDYYQGNDYGGTVGMFISPYYWWEAGLVFGGMLENHFLCGNNTYEELIYEAMIAQTGPDYDYMPSNQTMVEGNDDQGVWALTVMSAVERNFTNPKKEGAPGWLAMVQAVFNEMYSRWDEDHCGGGLRWQIFTWNSGYNYKNTISNGCLFQLAARLGRYTGNQTYLDAAKKVFQWLVDVNFVVLNDKANVFDGANIEGNCSSIVKYEWSYNHGVVLGGCAYMYNATNGSDVWESRTNQILSGAESFFFEDGVMYESTCQPSNVCNTDQRVFKAIFSRMLGYTAKLAPFSASSITPLLESSAAAAAKSCTGGTDGHTCGLNWLLGRNDAVYGLGEQACALEIMNQLLIGQNDAPYTTYNGGTSAGDPNAGLNISTTNILENKLNITGKDKAGAGIITAVILGALVLGTVWMIY